MKKKTFYIQSLIITILVSQVNFSQTEKLKYFEIGNPFLEYYSPETYQAGSSNWCIAQDKNGLMYFGNINNGLLEFDGTSWRFIKVPNNSTVRAIAIDEDNRVFIAAYKDFGYLEPDSVGQLEYKSLVGYLDKNSRDIGETWDIVTNSKAAYFKTNSKLFRWDGRKLFAWDSVKAFRLYKIGDDVYTRREGTGLMKIVGDSLILMPDGDFFASTGVFNMLSYLDRRSNKQKILVATNIDGLFVHDGYRFSKFKTEADSFLVSNQIYNACLLTNGNFAFATQRGGVAIVNQKGKLVNIINEKAGLPINIVYDVFQDNSENLWLATAKGIVHVEYPSPLSRFHSEGKLKSTFTSLLRVKNRLYGLNDLGLLYLEDGNDSFKSILGINKTSINLIYFKNQLLVGNLTGVGIIEGDKLSKWITSSTSNIIVESKYYSGRLYVGHRDGLSVLQKNENSKEFEVYQIPINEEIISIVEDGDKSIWIQSFDEGIKHITNDLQRISLIDKDNLKIRHYKYLNDKKGKFKWIYNFNNRLLLTSDIGIFKFNKEKDKFVIDSSLGSIFADSSNVILLLEKSNNGDIWLLTKSEEKYTIGKSILQKDGKYKWQPDEVLNRLKLKNVQALYSDYDYSTKKEVLWISSTDGLIRYNPETKKIIDKNYLTFVRSVKIKNDSIIYGGNYNSKYIPVLPYSNNDVNFGVSSVSYDNPARNSYQYFLKGNDENWSKWTYEPKKVYTNLSQGNYKFKVRSKNIYGVIGKEDVFAFNVLPPWYLTWWAFLFYLFIVGLSIFLTDRIMRKKLIKRERDRAKLREAELIKKQSEELETVDRLVKVINRAEDLETLFNSLLKQTLSFIPQAEKAAVFLLDKKDDLFKVAYTAGYKVSDLEKISFSAEELMKRYSQKSDEVEKGIYIINNTTELYGDKKMSAFSKAKSMLVMAVERDKNLEAFVVFDSFADRNVFDKSTARILNRFREHAVSAISKAQTLKELQEKNKEIIRTQEQLIVQEKLASLGALTAGIAHEIKNPLNFVNNFAEVSLEILDELADIIDDEKSGIQKDSYNNLKELIKILEQNFNKINNHGKRADSIIKGMLQHSRGSFGEKTLTNLNALLEQYISLAYHGLRAQDKEFNIIIEKNYDETLEKINIVPQNISRVLLNIIHNACYAAYDKKKKSKVEIKPELKVSTKNLKEKIEIRIRDNGNGIPKRISDKIFQPFYTTKPTGEGTGLGLSLSYDIIVKEHNGEIKFETEEGKYTEFIITLPKK